MVLPKAVLLLVVMVAAQTAAAQTPLGRNGADAEERPVAGEPTGDRAGPGVQATPRLVMAAIPVWLRDYAASPGLPRPMTLFAPPTLPPGARFVAPRNPAARALRVINGRFVPIPMLQWQRRAPFDSRAMLAVSPSIFVGRRPTFMPEGFRGGRTFGFAVHIRVNLTPPATAPTSPVSAAAGSRCALLATRVRTLLAAR